MRAARALLLLGDPDLGEARRTREPVRPAETVMRISGFRSRRDFGSRHPVDSGETGGDCLQTLLPSREQG